MVHDTTITTPPNWQIIEEILDATGDIGSGAAVLPKLHAVMNDPQCVLDDVVALIKLDPAIAARVIRVASSAFYSKINDGVNSVEAAIQRVGFARVYELVTFAMVAHLLMRPLRAYRVSDTHFWDRSAATALAADILSRQLRVEESSAYTFGLLHSIGTIIIDSWLDKKNAAIVFEDEGLPLQTSRSEQLQIGVCNAEVTSAALESWGFSASISQPIRYQYSPDHANGFAEGSCLLHIAKWVAEAALATDERPPMPAAAFLEPIGAATQMVEFTVQAVRASLTNITQLLAIPAG